MSHLSRGVQIYIMNADNLGLAALLLTVAACGSQHPQGNGQAALAERQAQVAERGRTVMPFDLERTMHHFKTTPSGGLQQVVSTDGDAGQIRLIREHLRTEAERFQRGDFSDPGKIHGPEMPGLRALAAGAGRIDIRYTDIPAGAQIAYHTSDPALRKAIHAWFDAQVREHGHHAMPM
jgi:hypothetical protein